MKIIAHRRNTIDELKSTPTEHGAEVDLRSNGSDIILQHDAFKPGVSFKEWLTHFHHETLILNVKEDGLESEILKLLKNHKIENFFFLDQPFPTLMKMVNGGEKRCAVRFSEHEPLAGLESLAGKAAWVWVDCFTKFPLTAEAYKKIKSMGFKICLVSPELQGRQDNAEITQMKNTIKAHQMVIDAVCTKKPTLWQGK